MKCLPRKIDLPRTVLKAVPAHVNDSWWTGIVRDRSHKTGEVRLRLERLVENSDGVTDPHVWRVRPDFWLEEQQAVTTLKHQGGSDVPGDLPIHERYTPREYVPVRHDDTRRVVAVRLDKPSGRCIRLYHWDADDGTVYQKFTTGQHWDDLTTYANRNLA